MYVDPSPGEEPETGPWTLIAIMLETRRKRDESARPDGRNRDARSNPLSQVAALRRTRDAIGKNDRFS